ncbi:putative F-box protein At5g52610 [Brachypodium distachyon]|nr:putative F-box protein At5g52610 [Brachypodium distachyon]|eukprot:XP_010230188.1 putative F-box protein At5g52610 [Brachypodium distachyon]
MDPTEALTDDALANILRRLPPCDLAASRCVRKVWRALVDAHRLLLPHLLPHSLHGFFINYIDYERPRFFSRPSTVRPVINSNLDFFPDYSSSFNPIVDHCNGLLLYEELRGLYVVNPATRRWEDLPMEDRDCNSYLVFDPAVTSHYEVFFIPYLPKKLVVPEPKKLEKFR